MSNLRIHLCSIHTEEDIQPSVIVLHDVMEAVDTAHFNQQCKAEGEFLGSVLFHALPEATRFAMGAMIRHLEEM
jgi:hypothetical protein